MAISNVSSGLRPGVCTSTTRPTAPFEGQMIYESDTNRVLVWDNAAWVMIADTDQPPGLQLVKTQTFTSATTAVNVDNCFSSDFQNYKVIMEHTATAAGAYNVRLRAGGVDNQTASSYTRERILSLVGVVNSTNSAAAEWTSIIIGETTLGTAELTFSRPFETVTTGVISFSGRATAVALSGGSHNQAVSYDGFSVLVPAGSITGTIRVYGYRD